MMNPLGSRGGDIVYRYFGPTYGVVFSEGEAITMESGRFPFCEVARENLEEYPQEIPS